MAIKKILAASAIAIFMLSTAYAIEPIQDSQAFLYYEIPFSANKSKNRHSFGFRLDRAEIQQNQRIDMTNIRKLLDVSTDNQVNVITTDNYVDNSQWAMISTNVSAITIVKVDGVKLTPGKMVTGPGFRCNKSCELSPGQHEMVVRFKGGSVRNNSRHNDNLALVFGKLGPGIILAPILIVAGGWADVAKNKCMATLLFTAVETQEYKFDVIHNEFVNSSRIYIRKPGEYVTTAHAPCA